MNEEEIAAAAQAQAEAEARSQAEAQEQQQGAEHTGEKPAGEAGAGAGAGAGAAAEDDGGEVVVTIGSEQPAEGAQEEQQERAPAWVRELRKANREKDRRIRELEAKLNAPASGQPAEIVVGARPTLAGCDYDEEKFSAELDAWHERKRKADAAAAEKARGEEAVRTAWQSKLDDYGKAKAALKVPDFDDAEAAAQDTLSIVQQGVIVSGADNPALVVYALGKNPAKAKELAAIADPVKFAFAVAKLEKDLKVQPRKKAPAPESVVRPSGAAGASAVGGELERLQAEADKTGDRSKVARYLREKARAAA